MLLNSSTPMKFQSTLSLRRATISPPVGHSTQTFQSTLSLRRATEMGAEQSPILAISIHALLAESDSKYHQIGPIVSV